MLRRLSRIVLVGLVARVQAITYSTETPRYLNTSTPHAIALPGPTVCCFAFQPTVSANYWSITSLSTSNYVLATVTSLRTYYTIFEDTGETSTSWQNITRYNVSTSTVYESAVGENPLFIKGGLDYLVRESTGALNGTATVTGGVLIQSPTAFYEYRVVDIVTVAPILDDGKFVCGTASTNEDSDVVYTDINEKAPAHYYNGGAPATQIVFDTPLIYAPARGANGATSTTSCQAGQGTEIYGYLPKTILESMVKNEKYSAQFPGLASCLPGGPPIRDLCDAANVVTGTTTTSPQQTPPPPPPPVGGNQGAIGGDLTETKVYYVTMPGRSNDMQAPKPNDEKLPPDDKKPPTNEPKKDPLDSQKTNPDDKKDPPNGAGDGKTTSPDGDKKEPPKPPTDESQKTSTGDDKKTDNTSDGKKDTSNGSGDGKKTPPDGEKKEPPKVPTDGNQKTSSGDDKTPEKENTSDGKNDPTSGGGDGKKTSSDGDKKDSPKAPSDDNQKTSNEDGKNPPKDNTSDNKKTSPEANAANEGPSNEKSGGDRKDDSIGGIINSIIGGPQQQIAGSKPDKTQIGSPTYIDGSRLVVIPGPTRIPLADAPQGVGGSTQVVDGKSYLVIPAAVTYQPSVANDVVGPTSIAIQDAPPDLKGSTQVVGDKSYLVVSTPQTIQAVAEKNGVTTTIGGVPFLIVGPTNVPLAGAPNVAGKTTYTSGTAYLEIVGSHTIPVNSAGSYGVKTTIAGVPYLEVGPTIVPVNGAPPGLEGKTTLINGTPFILVTSSTRVPLVGSNTVASGSTYLVVDATRVPLANAPSDLKGATTTIDGTPYLVVPTRTSMRVANGQLTVIIDGTSQLILSGPMTVPVNEHFSILGETTVVDGTTMVVVSERTTVMGKWTGVSDSSSSVSRTVPVPAPTTSSRADGRRLRVEMWIVTIVLVAFAR